MWDIQFLWDLDKYGGTQAKQMNEMMAIETAHKRSWEERKSKLEFFHNWIHKNGNQKFYADVIMIITIRIGVIPIPSSKSAVSCHDVVLVERRGAQI